MKQPPESLLPTIAWDFAQEAPETLEEFVAQVKSHNKELMRGVGVFSLVPIWNWIGRLNLSNDTGLRHLFVRYQMAVEPRPGEWVDVTRMVEIDAEETLTEGAVLFHLHHQAKGDLADQDHRFFEALELDKEAEEKSAPTYEMWLGS